MGIWITGDTHSDVGRFSVNSFYEQKEMTNQDENFVIILGDFGLVWDQEEESKTEYWWLNWLENKPFTTLFIDGNHENFDRLYKYPVKEWNGGKVHEIRPHVLHLMRGEIFEIEGKKFFAYGGASSHDISDGILDNDSDWKDKVKALEKQSKYMYRVRGLSWWDEELPSEEEMQNGIYNLEKHNWEVDYILSHSPSASVIALLGHGMYEQDILTKYLEDIRSKTEFKRHYAGHMHLNKQLNDKDILLYEQIIRIV